MEQVPTWKLAHLIFGFVITQTYTACGGYVLVLWQRLIGTHGELLQHIFWKTSIRRWGEVLWKNTEGLQREQKVAYGHSIGADHQRAGELNDFTWEGVFVVHPEVPVHLEFPAWFHAVPPDDHEHVPADKEPLEQPCGTSNTFPQQLVQLSTHGSGISFKCPNQAPASKLRNHHVGVHNEKI